MMCRSRQFGWVAGVIMVAVCANAAIAEFVVTTADGAGADSWIHSNDPNENFGNDNRMRARTQSKTRNMYMRFDISDLTFELADTTSATLSIFSDSDNDVEPENVVGLYGLADGDDDNWSETNITFNNAPLQIDESNNDSPLSSFTLPPANSEGDPTRYNHGSNEEFIFPSTTDLVDFVKADTNGLLTFIVQYQTDDIGSTLGAATKEHTTNTAPTLTLVPEPTSLSLLGLGGLVALRRRRRA